MGAWGGGLYDSDFARDLRGTIKAMLRAPLSDDELVSEIRAAVGADGDGIDGVDFWLVLADQFERSGMPRRDLFERAIEIVESEKDIALLRQLDATETLLAKRRKHTAELVERLRRPRAAKARRVLKQPESLLLDVGEALTWPTDRGDSINPYVPEEDLWKLGGFTQDGWGFGIITEAGHHFHVLAYYAVQVLRWRRPERPSAGLAIHCARAPYHYGTMRPLHLERSKAERLGRVPEAAIGPPPSPRQAERESRRAVLADIGLTGAFGYDAWNRWVIPGQKFPYGAPSGALLDPEEPDQRPGPEEAL